MLSNPTITFKLDHRTINPESKLTNPNKIGDLTSNMQSYTIPDNLFWDWSFHFTISTCYKPEKSERPFFSESFVVEDFRLRSRLELLDETTFRIVDASYTLNEQFFKKSYDSEPNVLNTDIVVNGKTISLSKFQFIFNTRESNDICNPKNWVINTICEQVRHFSKIYKSNYHHLFIMKFNDVNPKIYSRWSVDLSPDQIFKKLFPDTNHKTISAKRVKFSFQNDSHFCTIIYADDIDTISITKNTQNINTFCLLFGCIESCNYFLELLKNGYCFHFDPKLL